MAAAMLLLGATARAGTKYYAPTYVNLAGRNASGALGSARNSPDSTGSLGCQTNGYSTSSSIVVLCWANDVNGYRAVCSSSNPQLAAVVGAMTGDAYVAFSWDASGTCTWINVRHMSYYEPKK